jgi:hypothetical protein
MKGSLVGEMAVNSAKRTNSESDPVGPASLTRQELHALVWAHPVSHLAKRFGISDQGLAKICDRFDIPRPRAGHWNKIAAGKGIATPALPPARTGTDETITIVPPTAGGVTPVGHSALAAARQNARPVHVTERLSDPHPIIAGWLADRKEAIAKGRSVADIWANRPVPAAPFTPTERRRLRVLDALLKALEAAQVVVTENGRRGLVARCGRDEIEFQVKPKLKEVRQPLTPEERRWYAGKEYRRELVETDTLVFEVKRWLPGDLPHKWQDGRKGTIETMAGDILVTLLAAFPLMAMARERAEERERLRQIEERRRYELQQQRKLEENRFRRLLEHAGKWREAELARDFLGALRAAIPDSTSLIDGKPAGEWLEWAEARASLHDPLQSDPLGIFETIAKVTNWTYRDT